MAHETIVDDKDAVITAGMLADRLRPLVLASCDRGETGSSCLDKTPMIPLHRATVGAVYHHLERLAHMDREKTVRSLEMQLAEARTAHASHIADIENELAERRRSQVDG